MSITTIISAGITEFRKEFEREPDYILIRPKLRQLIKDQTGAFNLPETIDGIRFEYSIHMPLNQGTIMSKDDKAVIVWFDHDN